MIYFNATGPSGVIMDCSMSMNCHSIYDVNKIYFCDASGTNFENWLGIGESLDIHAGLGHNIHFKVEGEQKAMIIDSATGDVRIRKNMHFHSGDRSVAIAPPDSISGSHILKLPGPVAPVAPVAPLPPAPEGVFQTSSFTLPLTLDTHNTSPAFPTVPGNFNI